MSLFRCLLVANQFQLQELVTPETYDSSSHQSCSSFCSRSVAYGSGCLLAAICVPAARHRAGATLYFVTYSSALEEPGNLEISLKNTQASPKNGNPFLGSVLELEYGVKGWWTTEFYLDGQATKNDDDFTGFRWENRFRPLLREHWINPVLYVEYENTNLADRGLLEIVGHDTGRIWRFRTRWRGRKSNVKWN